ncbi:restriction endonuclease subunit S [Bacteroides ovatus]|uniref:restriction endonuclease subunit S n=1 Tax=Bacteroides ovatus TaxID=28116 RepID=UPI00123117A7|nr:restriction endonuclease subunit S [Bacteroides ovatus]KAA4092704.1 restriction endonuclease subunit S [Bacteroides ovatus]KAA4148294.1 restriction endonuclease subunit S [Bacteroides ovatus]KAA4151132.1 restriction endonuclease subunit S [Bacteroides ovatus]KAA4165609.1 restriction endonuclease subunit S [Bacteroides ovatus]KAA4224640.1 restriction endonuclease subunit S [Bacteroides ovatus]
MGEISNYGDSINVQVDRIKDNDWILELEDIEKDSANINQFLKKSERSISGVRHQFYTGEILYSKLRTYLNKVLVAPKEGYCTTELMSFNTYGVMSNKFVCHVLRSPYFLDYTLRCGYGVKMPRLSTADACKGMIPLPPLGEQQRIVAKIERWFSLIEQIEQVKNDLQTAIKQAKSKILDLAIHGKLVPQNPNDEPASKLLKRINPKAKITSDNEHYENLPNGWCYASIKEVFKINPRNKADDSSKAGFISMTNISDGYFNTFRYETRQWYEVKTGFTHFADGDIAVAKISPCLENRKSIILKDLPNGIGAGTTELYIFRSQCIDAKYGLFFFKSDYFINQCINSFNGVVGQQRVSKSIIEDIDIAIPPLEEQMRIANKVSLLFSTLDKIAEEL